METHIAEVTALEKKISSMEREAVRWDKEIKGLTWLVVNNKGPPGSVLPINGAPHPPSLLEIDQARSQARVSVRKFSYTDDSGVESYPMSGASLEQIQTIAQEPRGQSLPLQFTIRSCADHSLSAKVAAASINHPNHVKSIGTLNIR